MHILAFTEHAKYFYAGEQGLCATKILEPQHRANTPLNPAMVLLYQVIQIFVLPDGDAFFIGFVGVECGQRGRIGATFINGYHLWLTVVANGLAKETQCGCGVTFGGQ